MLDDQQPTANNLHRSTLMYTVISHPLPTKKLVFSWTFRCALHIFVGPLKKIKCLMVVYHPTYIPLIYCLLGGYTLPTTFDGNQKQPFAPPRCKSLLEVGLLDPEGREDDPWPTGKGERQKSMDVGQNQLNTENKAVENKHLTKTT